MPGTPIADESLGARCCTRRAPPAGRRASCARCPSSRRRSRCRYSSFVNEPVALPRGHDVPVARRRCTTRRRRPRWASTIRDGRHGDHHGALRSGAVPGARRAVPGHATASSCRRCSSRMLKLPEDVRQQLRPVVAGDRRPRRRAVPDAGEGADDRVVGTRSSTSTTAPPKGLGFTACDTAEWLAHRGTVGKVLLGELHILDENMQPAAEGQAGHAVVQDGQPISTTSTIRQDR